MRYAQVYTEAGIPKIWDKFQMSKECDDNRQELLAGIMYWSKTNVIEVNTAVLFFKLAIQEMVKTKFNPGGLVARFERFRKWDFTIDGDPKNNKRN